MGPGTFEAKFIPLSKIDFIDNIYVLRKQKGPTIRKVSYILLPKVCRIKWISLLITPFILMYHTRIKNARIILAYHVIPHAFYAFVASLLSGVPFCISQTGLKIERLSSKWLFGRIILYIFNKAKYINVPGSKSRQHWIDKGINPAKISILHSTVSTDDFFNTKSNIEYDFIFIGRLATEKNIELMFKAIIELKKRNLEPMMVIVGDGPEEIKLKEFVYSNELVKNIVFTGFQADVAKWLNTAEIFVMASTSDAMPTSLMQAMACERICISSRVGNIPDLIIHENNGFLFESNNLEGLTKLMALTLERKGNYCELRRKARLTIIQNHSHTIAQKKWEDQLVNFE